MTALCSGKICTIFPEKGALNFWKACTIALEYSKKSSSIRRSSFILCKSSSFITFRFVSCTLTPRSFFNFKLFIVITDIVSSHVLYKSHLLIVFSRNVKYPCMFLFRRSEFSLPNHLPYASKSLLHCFYTLIIIALSGKKQA